MLILLIGAKGSGKSHVGRVLEARLGVHFFHVEPHWIRYHQECRTLGRPILIEDGIRRIHPLVTDALDRYAHVSVETTGASEEILHDLIGLGKEAGLVLVRVLAPLSLCLERVASRDQAHQIPMNEAGIRQVYALSEALDLNFDVQLETIELSESQIIRPFLALGIGEAEAG